MKRTFLILVSLLLTFGILVGCSKTETKENSVDLLNSNWEEIAAESKGQVVNIHMWGGDNSVNEYIDIWAAPKLKEKFDITLNRVPINDARDMVNKILTEKDVNKTKGSIDIFWINGENFKICKDNELLWGDFVDKLPKYNEFVDKNADDMKYDFGESTEGLEAPWGKSQFVFIYDSDKVKNPPKSMEELKEWVIKNPGKFTYSAPPDFTGSAFVRQVLIDITGESEQYVGEIDKDEFNKKCELLWDYLNDIKPYLWREGKTYPESSTKLDQLYGNGEVWMTMSYNPMHALNKIETGEFSSTSRVFLLEKGTLSNTHYLSIPFNASNKAGAMVVINFLLSPEAQITKFDSTVWGDGLAISADKLSQEYKDKLKSINTGENILKPEELEKHRIPEISSEYVDQVEKGWMKNVAKEKK
jgi:putative spermidine/putrescine transport system substrate-binding protein